MATGGFYLFVTLSLEVNLVLLSQSSLNLAFFGINLTKCIALLIHTLFGAKCTRITAAITSVVSPVDGSVSVVPSITVLTPIDSWGNKKKPILFG